MPDSRRGPWPHGLAAALVAAALLSACGGPSSRSDTAREQSAAPQETSAQSGDVVVRANAIATTHLSGPVAMQYGVARDDSVVMLLVGVRKLVGGQEISLPVRIRARAVDLLGKVQSPAMREVRSGEFIDYVGSFRISPPETLSFEIEVTPADQQPVSLKFNRDFFPQ